MHTGQRFVPFYIECSAYKWGKMVLALSTDSYSLYCVCVCVYTSYIYTSLKSQPYTGWRKSVFTVDIEHELCIVR